MSTTDRSGKIVTFYSYKGGTGRSMALANIAWVLATAGKKVLTIDWDLEAPGLHRYFEPFLSDKGLEQSSGIIDFVRDFVAGALAPASEESHGSEWYEPYSDLVAYAMAIDWEFPEGGSLDLVPAGKQDAAYAGRVNSFDWHAFYEKLGGGVLLEKVKQRLRRAYDFVLIDSRTGVSDTSGVCTMQMPDDLVVCFTLNKQSIYGASAAARSAFLSRHTSAGQPTLKIWPVPTRVEVFEKDRLEIASTLARARFSGLMPQFDPEREDRYWGEISVNYEPYYAYEEVLASFRDLPRQAVSMLSRMEAIAGHLDGKRLVTGLLIDPDQRTKGLAAFMTRSASDLAEELGWLGTEYDSLRDRMPGGAKRTELMSLLVGRAQMLAGDRDVATMAERLFFGSGTPGCRIIGLALARSDPQRQHIELALSGIAESRSPFEQFQALMLASALVKTMQPDTAERLKSAIEGQINKTIDRNDQSRLRPAQRLLKQLQDIGGRATSPGPVPQEHPIGAHDEQLVVIVPSSTLVRYTDPPETHGRWVGTRGLHVVRLASEFRLGRYFVTNSFFRLFVQSGGYENDAFWSKDQGGGAKYASERNRRARFTTSDGRSLGPGHWHGSEDIPEGLEEHPVTSICFYEAQAFVNWCNSVDGSNRWSLPSEDQWEFAARSEQGQLYPWGDVFDAAKCNSAESGTMGTTPVNRFENGASNSGCCDMAGNVWEFVLADYDRESLCVLRGGSFKNSHTELRSYLRLFGVPKDHRPADFGFRLAWTSPYLGRAA